MRIIYVPQYPTPMRYQEWWFWKLPEEFKKAGHEVIVLGKKYTEMIESRRGALDMFSPIDAAIWLETEQVKEYMSLDLEDGDVLFLSDLSFPGIFATTLFHHKRPRKMFAFCHATSINKGDYFEHFRNEKFMIETAFAKTFDKVFVGSQYHANKLQWDNTVVTYLPLPPFERQSKLKSYDIMSASRPNPQKVDLHLEEIVETKFGKIYRPSPTTWEGYFSNLAKSKILLITSHEDTFGYQIIDAILNGCIPIARNNLAYPEILPYNYLYNDEYELMDRIEHILNKFYSASVPVILCQTGMDNFYNRIIKEMED